MPGKTGNMIFTIVTAAAITCALLSGGCGGGSMQQSDSQAAALGAISPGTWSRLSGKRIFFGHQSVGAGIVAGLEEIASRIDPLTLFIVEGTGTADPAAPVFLHARIGTNGDPAGKLARFGELIRGDLGATLDIAFLKFCYLDITAGTDVPRLFARYQQEMIQLKKARPDITFIHTTVPLTTVQTGPVAFVKRLLGRLPGGYADNARRNEFNMLMRLAYAGEEPFFDLELLESTRGDGTRVTFMLKGKQHFSLDPSCTNDGGHLNDMGRRVAAERLLLLLAQL
jgi:hypothetical protein